MVKPAAWMTGVVPSAPRVTVQDWAAPVPPGATVAIMVSVLWAGSMILNVVPLATDTCGNALAAVMVQLSDVPWAGAVVPPLVTVPEPWLVRMSFATDHPGRVTARPRARTARLRS